MPTLVRTFAVLSLVTLAARAEPARVLVGPDVLVSSDSESPHTEMMIAAHPSDPRKLVAGSMVLMGGAGTSLYSSTDGGATWAPAYPPGRIAAEADPLVLYTPRGTALFVDLPVIQRTPEGKPYLPLTFYRSEDGGQTWHKPILLGDTTQGHDHPQIAVDPRSGRIYISSLYGEEYILGLFRSDDDGRTFTGPKEMTRVKGEESGYNTTGLAVLSDGTLVHFFLEFAIGKLQDSVREHKGRVMLSRDGGETFSKPLLVGQGLFPPKSLDGQHRGQLHSFSQMAADASTGPFRDRIYIAWTDFRTGLPQVVLTWSADRGETWSEPRAVAAPFPEGAYSFQPALAVNKDGILGVSWLDTRNHPGSDRYDAYFSASLDGGETFLPPARLSSETSDPIGSGNLRPAPGSWPDHEKTIRVTFLTALSRYANGGDYAGLAADADGAFHPLWPDSRSGTFQAWTTKVRVERGPAVTAPAATTAPSTDLKEHVELLIDPAAYDLATQELRLPIRIRNRSERPIRGPLQIKVKTFGSGMGDGLKENTPAILNAANGQAGAGAVFDYSQALGDFDVLEPGAVTEPVVWRFKLVAVRTPDMHVEVTGRVE